MDTDRIISSHRDKYVYKYGKQNNGLQTENIQYTPQSLKKEMPKSALSIKAWLSFPTQVK